MQSYGGRYAPRPPPPSPSRPPLLHWTFIIFTFDRSDKENPFPRSSPSHPLTSPASSAISIFPPRHLIAVLAISHDRLKRSSDPLRQCRRRRVVDVAAVVVPPSNRQALRTTTPPSARPPRTRSPAFFPPHQRTAPRPRRTSPSSPPRMRPRQLPTPAMDATSRTTPAAGRLPRPSDRTRPRPQPLRLLRPPLRSSDTSS
jgi:hypothetical protein